MYHLTKNSFFLTTNAKLKQLNEDNNAGLSEAFLINQCFVNKYVTHLLVSYGFDSFSPPPLTMTDKINGYSLNWALGYMINELNRDDFLPYEEPPRKLNRTLFVTLTCLLSLACLGALVYMLYAKMSRLRTSMRRNAEEIPFSPKRNNQKDLVTTTAAASPVANLNPSTTIFTTASTSNAD